MNERICGALLWVVACQSHPPPAASTSSTATGSAPTTASASTSATAAPRCAVPKDELPDGAPKRDALYRMLLKHASLALKGHEWCDGVVPSVDDPTLGDWIAANLAALESNADVNRLPISCRADAGGWSCDVSFYTCHAAGNHLYNWGVRVFVKPDGSLDPASIKCTGSG